MAFLASVCWLPWFVCLAFMSFIAFILRHEVDPPAHVLGSKAWIVFSTVFIVLDTLLHLGDHGHLHLLLHRHLDDLR